MQRLVAGLGAILFVLSASMPTLAGNAADEVAVQSPYVRAVPPMMQNSAAFMALENTGSSNRAVVAAASPAAETVELHTHTMDDGMMRMRQVDRIEIAAGATTVLEPGGLHVMLLGLKQPLEVGGEVRLELTFDDGSTRTVVAPVTEVQPAHRMHHGM
jgi:copper(I)-binding protein